MSTEVLNVTVREQLGSRHCQRLRAAGQIPAVLYGHGEPSVALTLSLAEAELALRHNAHLVELRGGVNGNALLRDVQYDAMGSSVLHIDLTRVEAGETVEVTLPLVLRGEAPGALHGGVVEMPLHTLEIRCPVGTIPDTLEVNVNHLEVGQSITAGELPLPKDAQLCVPAETVVVTCSVAGEVAETAEGAAGAEPELIGRPAKEEESES